MNALDVEQKAKISKGRFLKFLVLVISFTESGQFIIRSLLPDYSWRLQLEIHILENSRLSLFFFFSWICFIQPSTLHAIILVSELFFTHSHLLDFIMAALCVSSYVNFNYLVLNKRVIQFGKETLPSITLVFWQCNEKSLTWFAISLLIIPSTQHNPARRVLLNQGIDNYSSHF